jgi:hypothetical protein
MPWTSNDAERHTHKATTPTLKALWAKVANERLESTGDERRARESSNAASPVFNGLSDHPALIPIA